MNRLLPATPLVAAVLTGCGGGNGGSGDSKSLQPKGKPDPAAAQVAQRYVNAYSVKDATTICGLVATTVRAQLGGQKCVVTIKRSFRHSTFPKFKVGRAYVDGTTAHALLTGSPRQITLTRESGGWKVLDGGS